MALHNLARMTSATTGTSTLTLGSAVSGFLSFADAGVVDGEVLTYSIRDGANSETGYGTYTASGTTLSRTTILSSTNSGNAIDCSGSQEVFVSALAENFSVNYDPDIAPVSPNAADDEFDDETIAVAWTQIGSPDTISEATYHGYLFVEDNDSTACGIRKAYAPGAAAFTVACKISTSLVSSYSNVILAIETSVPATIASIGLQNNNAFSIRSRNINGATETNTTIGGDIMPRDFYLLVDRDATTNFNLKISKDGINWITLASFSNAGTVANVSILMDSQGGGTVNSCMSIDFIRFFASQTGVIGANFI